MFNMFAHSNLQNDTPTSLFAAMGLIVEFAFDVAAYVTSSVTGGL